jgi:dephospho-CoA kinase
MTAIRRIALAGYMGAGKTTIAAMLAEQGSCFINADKEAKALMQQDDTIKRSLEERFGNDVVEGGNISSQLLGERAFRSMDDLKLLNSIVHPELIRKLRELVFSSDCPVCILDAALVPLWHIEPWFDIRIWIEASFETRLQRIIDRTGLDEAVARNRMHLQEQLVPRPSKKLWNIIVNEHENIETLRADLEAIFGYRRQE